MRDDEPCPCLDIGHTMRSVLEGHPVPECPRHSYGAPDRRSHSKTAAQALNSSALEDHLHAVLNKVSQRLL